MEITFECKSDKGCPIESVRIQGLTESDNTKGYEVLKRILKNKCFRCLVNNNNLTKGGRHEPGAAATVIS